MIVAYFWGLFIGIILSKDSCPFPMWLKVLIGVGMGLGITAM